MSQTPREVQTPDGPARLIREWWPTDPIDPHRWFIVEYQDGRRKLVGAHQIITAGARLDEKP